MEHGIEIEETTVARGGRVRSGNSHATPGTVVALGPRDSLVGTLTVDGDVRVQGTVEGEIRASGDVDVERSARVQARVEGATVTVRGNVTGNIAARRRLILGGSGHVTGDVRAAKLQVEDGAIMNGSISMGPVDELTFETTGADSDTGETAPDPSS
ncbi:MAG TPA: polymer-forming cytoskeletal protein [Candidatus Dormibacteraeota bacterium]